MQFDYRCLIEDCHDEIETVAYLVDTGIFNTAIAVSADPANSCS